MDPKYNYKCPYKREEAEADSIAEEKRRYDNLSREIFEVVGL